MFLKTTNRQAFAWAFYDWANSAYAATVLAVFFPVFFKEYCNAGVDVTVSTLRLGMANSFAGMVIVLIAPVVGAIADRGNAKKKFLLSFAALGIVMTAALFLVAQGQWLLAGVLYALATIGFTGGNIFYDSLIVSVVEPERSDYISSLGYAVGYLGGGLLLALNVAMALSPSTFGFASKSEAVRACFVSVAVWWAVFSIPLILYVREPHTARTGLGRTAITAGFRQLAATFRQVRRLRQVALFLAGYWLYIDGLDTIVRMAVDYGLSLGFQTSNLIIAVLITQFVGFPAAIGFGWLGERIGARIGIFIGLAVYIGVCVWGRYMEHTVEFYGIAVVVGLVQGGVQALSRSFYSRIIPRNKAGEFFGFYNMLGKFAVVVGPLLMGWVGVLTHNPRDAILSVAVLFVGGAALLYFVDEAAGHHAARELERAS